MRVCVSGLFLSVAATIAALASPHVALTQNVVENPTSNQPIQQPTTPSLTTLSVNNFNKIFYVDGTKYAASIAGINSAANDASSNGGKVIVPVGTYSGSATLTIPANVTVECDGWDAVLQFTSGTLSPAVNLSGNGAVLRGCKVDGSGVSGLADVIDVNGAGTPCPTNFNQPPPPPCFVLLDHNWIKGKATDGGSTFAVRLLGAGAVSQFNLYDTVLEVTLQAVSQKSIQDTFVNYLTGVFVSNASEFVVDHPHCVSTNGTGVTAGDDCVNVTASQHGEIDSPWIEAAREHGVYIGAKAAGTYQPYDVKVIGGLCANQGGACFKVRGDSPAHPDYDIVFDGLSAVGSSASGAEGFLAGNVQHLVISNSLASLQSAHGFEIDGGSFIELSSNIAEFNNLDGLRLRDYDGPITHLSVRGGKYDNNSQSPTKQYSGIELICDGATGGSQGAENNSDIAVEGVEASDTQGASQTQTWGAALDACTMNMSNHTQSTVTRLFLSNVRGQGNSSGLINSLPISGYSTVIETFPNIATGSTDTTIQFPTGLTVGSGNSMARYARYTATESPAAITAHTCTARSFTNVTGVLSSDVLIAVSKPTEQAGLAVMPGARHGS
ncbi:MAG TPA: hypothetical protein VKQ11_13445 [Candidatus Sulfotelmatobacter sp.]|nr:hypothetical protein [Candidatus Sulfotelmatobacter sp.]